MGLLMHARLHLPLQAALWALAPILDETGVHDSPSLIIMPISAALAVLASAGWRSALLMPVAGICATVVGYVVWEVSTGRDDLADAIAFGLGIIPFHVIVTWILVGLFWWPGRKLRTWRARTAGAPEGG